MSAEQRFILVENNSRRRAEISFQLHSEGYHVEPYESAAELALNWPTGGVLLIGDNGNSIADVLQQMERMGDWLPMIAYADEPETSRVVDVVLEGAIDYVGLPLDPGKVLSVLARSAVRVANVAGFKLREVQARRRIDRLTARERDVLIGVRDGLPNRMIGERLSISPRTVEIHRSNMLGKLGAAHTSEAIRIALEASLRP